jgi:hypothetical protein
MIESNFYILSHMRPLQAQRSKRIAHLEHTLAQLAQYHKVAPVLKRPIIFRLIVNYENLINKVKGE